jgi:hypothetical protein
MARRDRLIEAYLAAKRRETRRLNMAGERFVCPDCRRVSFHPDDIRERYCGHCHRWMDERSAKRM